MKPDSMSRFSIASAAERRQPPGHPAEHGKFLPSWAEKLLYIRALFRTSDREGEAMQRGWRSARAARAAGVAGLLVLCCPWALSAAPCDEYDPGGPSRSARITLNSGDFVDQRRDEMRSFVATGSIGRVDAG